MSDVRELAPTAFVQGTSAVCDAVLRLRGDALVQELSRLARTLTGSAQGRFVPGPGLVDHPVIDRQPVGVLQVGHHHTQLPGPAGFGRWSVGLPRGGARVGKRQLPAHNLRRSGDRCQG